MFDNFKNVIINNKFYILLVTFIIALFLSVAYYYYNTFIRAKLKKQYVDNKEFIDENDENNNKSKEATLFFFYTTWCPYCKVSRPEWDKLIKQTNGVVKNTKIIFRDIDCDKNSDLADKYKVEGYPTIKLIYNNKIYDYDAKPSVQTLNEFLNSVIN